MSLHLIKILFNYSIMTSKLYKVVNESDLDAILVNNKKSLTIIMLSDNKLDPAIKTKFVNYANQYSHYYFIFINIVPGSFNRDLNKYFTTNLESLPTFMFYFGITQIGNTDLVDALPKMIVYIEQKLLDAQNKVQKLLDAQNKVPETPVEPEQHIKEFNAQEVNSLQKRKELINQIYELQQYNSRIQYENSVKLHKLREIQKLKEKEEREEARYNS